MSFDRTFAKLRATASRLSTTTKTLLLRLRGYQTGDAASDQEGDDDAVMHGALGIVARPKPADENGAMEVLAARQTDGFLPFAVLDRRLTQARGEIGDGVISLVGYMGQHVTLEDGATPGQAKLSLVMNGARLTIEGGLTGPTITIERDGPPPSSITLGPSGNVDIIGTALTFNGVPMQVP